MLISSLNNTLFFCKILLHRYQQYQLSHRVLGESCSVDFILLIIGRAEAEPVSCARVSAAQQAFLSLSGTAGSTDVSSD